MRFPILAFTLLLLTTIACNRYYTSEEFEAKTFNHEKIAILPFEMLLTGRIPKDLTEEQIQAIEIAESKAFQSSFAHQIRAQGNRRKRYLRVDIQAVETTNSILKENGLGIRESWKMDPDKLAEMLDVDAVVRSKVIKERYLSDLESIGIGILGNVLYSIFGNPNIWIGNGLSRTATVNVGVILLDRKSQSVLFSTNQDMDVDWTQPANQAIDNICRRVARRMPYSVKK